MNECFNNGVYRLSNVSPHDTSMCHGMTHSAPKNGEWWALGRDITSALEYKDSSKAIEQHVRNKNRKSLSIKAYGDLSDTLSFQHLTLK